MRWGGVSVIMCLILSLMCVAEADARDRSWGLGFMIGRPSGLATQVPLTRQSALNTSLYYDLRDPSIDVHLDQIFISSRPYFTYIYPYFGWGGYLEIMAPHHDDHHGHSHHSEGDFDISARVPVGIEFGRHHWRGFFEIAPSVLLLPALRLHIGGSIGVRYHF